MTSQTVPQTSKPSSMPSPLLGEVLVERLGLQPEHVERALNAQAEEGGRLGEVLVSLGFAKEEAIIEALSLQWGLPSAKHLDMKNVPMSLVERIPIGFAKQFRLLPLWENDRTVGIATPDPLNISAFDDLQVMFQKPIQPYLVASTILLPAINQIYEQTAHHHATQAIEDLHEEEESLDRLATQIDAPQDLLDTVDDAPLIRLVNSMLFQGVKQRASDIHVEPYERELLVRYRIDGILYQVLSLSPRLQPSILSRIKILAGLNIAEKRLPQDGRFGITTAGKPVDIRVSIIPTSYGERAVLRLLEKNDRLLDLGEIGLSPPLHSTVTSLLGLSHGIVLVTGPTGSGKTTTLYAGLTQINTSERNILTIEDPVEYQLPGVGQIQVNSKIDLTFANGLRSILRQDPDVIMVGEIRDRETAEIAIHASLTGHLVFSTLHTNDSAGAVTRLIDMGIEPFLIASSVVAIIAQRLLREICPDCKTPYEPSTEELQKLGVPLSQFPQPLRFYRGAGCEACLSTGYRGRVGIYEILVMNDDIRALTLAREDSTQLLQTAVQQGMTTLWMAGTDRILQGHTTTEEVVRVLQQQDTTTHSE